MYIICGVNPFVHPPSTSIPLFPCQNTGHVQRRTLFETRITIHGNGVTWAERRSTFGIDQKRSVRWKHIVGTAKNVTDLFHPTESGTSSKWISGQLHSQVVRVHTMHISLCGRFGYRFNRTLHSYGTGKIKSDTALNLLFWYDVLLQDSKSMFLWSLFATVRWRSNHIASDRKWTGFCQFP